ncbi:histidine phosphatase family protein [Nonomuraea soli]|uniref:Putative phosphoglycerate mutase n=1 Tax=Nonomuraea soli TaxID=1032476 RepID=A0A7W0CKN5_9ACTN|nr:histidine phosphatase family protein [Nonomuraea soli]MBA2892861.1 putative phosphoglycerate mutase [Nonomuraea soli]
MTRLVLVRHGETVWHAENRYAGVSDVGLTERGHRQAERLAEWAGSAGLAAVWSSTLSRASLTAERSTTRLGLPLGVDERLRELDFGQGEGLTRQEMAGRFPEALEAFKADPVAHHLPGGEDPVRAAERFAGCLAGIAAAHEGERVLVVAHTTAIRLTLCRLIGLPLREYRRVFPSLRNCALTEIELDGPRAAVLEYNGALA